MKSDLPARIYRAFARPMALLAAVIVIGTAGFMYFGGPKYSVLDALYMTWITIFTIGYGEIVDLEKSPAGRVFNMIVATIGMGMIAYLWARLAAFIVESDLDQLWRRRRMLERISKCPATTSFAAPAASEAMCCKSCAPPAARAW